METLRFLMVSTYYPPLSLGGDAYFVKYLSEELVRNGHEVHVFYNPSAYNVMRAGRTPAKDNEEDFVVRHEHACRHPELDMLSSLIIGHDGNSLRGFETAHKEVKPDVVHWHNTRGFIGRPPPTRDAVTLATAHDYYMVCPRSNLLRPNMSACREARFCSMCSLRWKKPPQLWRFGRRRTLRPRGNVSIISPSKFLASRLTADGVDVQWILNNFVPDAGARTHNRSSDGGIIVYLGMLELHKGVMTLVRSFINTKEDQGFTLILVGDGSLRTKLEDLSRKSGLGSRVQVKGFLPRDELDRLLSTATFQVIPSEWYENAPLVAIEALSRGVPILASNMGGLPEILTPDTGSMTFTGGDSRDLERELVKAWNHRDEIAASGRKARAEYERRYTPKVHMKGYAKIIDHLHDISQ